MIRFAELFPDQEIVNALRTQLSWTHFRELLSVDDPLKRDFYAEICSIERWSSRPLRHKIGHLLFERTAVSEKPDDLVAADIAALRDEDRRTPDLVFRDPYFLDFLGLTTAFLEKDVEQAILRELEVFILELGGDFAFVARQKRISVDHEDYGRGQMRLTVSPMMKNGRMKSNGRQHTLPTDSDRRVTNAPGS
jgi:predicted nuclease of restriction endonuclease-like (RecB) superfamily